MICRASSDELFSEMTIRVKGTDCLMADSMVWSSISGRSRVAITRAVVVMILVSCVEVATLCLVQGIPEYITKLRVAVCDARIVPGP